MKLGVKSYNNSSYSSYSNKSTKKTSFNSQKQQKQQNIQKNTEDLPFTLKTLIDRHNDLVFEEKIHKYSHKTEPQVTFTSGTTVIHKFCKPFDAEEISHNISKGNEVKKAILQCEWACSAPIGTKIHRLAELYCIDKQNNTNYYTEELKSLNCTQLDYFIKSIDIFLVSGWKILQPEMRIYGLLNKYQGISGTADLILYKPKSRHSNTPQEIMIADFKTCNKIPRHSFNGETMKQPITNLQDCKHDHYALQLSLYQYLMESYFSEPEYNIKVLGRVLIQAGENGTQELIPVPYLKDEVLKVINHLTKESASQEQDYNKEIDELLVAEGFREKE